jgi:hypothetical protein
VSFAISLPTDPSAAIAGKPAAKKNTIKIPLITIFTSPSHFSRVTFFMSE